MIFHSTDIGGVFVIELETRSDERGSFTRIFALEEFEAAGLEHPIAHVNATRTAEAGTVRGLHFQVAPSSEDKYVRCTRGALFDVAVDVRSGSPTFGRHVAVELTATNGLGLLVPKGCAHGLQTLTDETEALYLASAAFDHASERGLRYDDPDLAIPWPLPVSTVSEKDGRWPAFGPHRAVDLLDATPAPGGDDAHHPLLRRTP